jgi:phage tail-like protein
MAIPGIRIDPVPGFNFYISLIDYSGTLALATSAVSAVSAVVGGGFSECSGLDATLQVEEYMEGGENSYVHKFPTRMTYGNITLKRGVTFAEDLWNWHAAYANGTGKRRDGVIVLLDEMQLLPIKTWRFKRGLPLKWTGPTLNASQSAIAIESLEIMHQGLELYSVGTAIELATTSIAARF